MNCTEKDRDYCNVEKMGHEGCAYAEEIDVLREKIKKLTKDRDYYKKLYLEFANALIEGGQKLTK